MDFGKLATFDTSILGLQLPYIQLERDLDAMKDLLFTLPRGDGVLIFGIVPYFALVLNVAFELFGIDEKQVSPLDDILSVKDVRLKLKVFEGRYGESKKMILNIDYLMNRYPKALPQLRFLKFLYPNYNLGVYL